MKPLVIVVAREQSYASGELAVAADSLGIELVFASDRCHLLAEIWPEGSIPISFESPEEAARAVAESLGARAIAATLGTDEATAVVAEAIAHHLGVPASRTGAAARAGDKLLTREAFSAAGLPCPAFVLAPLTGGELPAVAFPAVVKPRCLSASRGVMRVDSSEELEAALARLARIMNDADLRGRFGERCDSAVIESYVRGPEIAFEGALINGTLHPIAIFDKPRPLEGPHFAESLYVVPTALGESMRERVRGAVSKAAAALGLSQGPIHAELRLGEDEPVVIEIAARSIGGLCGRTLSLASGYSVAEVVLAKLTGTPIDTAEHAPAGVAMLLPPTPGVFIEMAGLEEALAIDGIEAVEITAPAGQRVSPPPDGSDYLGFVFARGADRAAVIDALSAAEAALVPEIRVARSALS